ncbi:MAG: DUF3549 family protein [Gammaproteobacteria bacterium]|nr:DUF3549 family protein [Gammaproteobacteria bacterium]
MSSISGITDFLDQAGTQFKVFDMGRRIQELDKDSFLAFEQGEQAYPWPLQQQAWLGMMVWNESGSADELVIWFLRFPLDATGKLTAGIRDDFVLRLLDKDRPDSNEESNPYGFKPRQEHMAVFHARAAKILGQPASRFYQHAQDYFSGQPGFDQWAFVGFQGIADVSARLDEDNNLQHLLQALPQLPAQPLEAVCQCLEHEILPQQLSEIIAQRLNQELAAEAPDANIVSLCIRALSGSDNPAICEQQISRVLSTPEAQHPEVLASISGRCWKTLNHPERIMAFLENLAQCPEGQEFFNLVIVDLINIPGMQQPLMDAVKSPDRSAALSKAIGELFQQFTQ